MKKITLKDIKMFFLIGIVLFIGYGNYYLEELLTHSEGLTFTILRILYLLSLILEPEMALLLSGVLTYYYLVSYQQKSEGASFVLILLTAFLLGQQFNAPIKESISTLHLILIFVVPQIANLLAFLMANSVNCLISIRKE